MVHRSFELDPGAPASRGLHRRRGGRQVRHGRRPGAGRSRAAWPRWVRRPASPSTSSGSAWAAPSTPTGWPRRHGAPRARRHWCMGCSWRISARVASSLTTTFCARSPAPHGLEERFVDEVLGSDAFGPEVRGRRSRGPRAWRDRRALFPHQRGLAGARARRTSRRWHSSCAGPGHASAIVSRISSTISTVVFGWRKAKRATVSPSQWSGVTKPIWSEEPGRPGVVVGFGPPVRRKARRRAQVHGRARCRALLDLAAPSRAMANPASTASLYASSPYTAMENQIGSPGRAGSGGRRSRSGSIPRGCRCGGRRGTRRPGCGPPWPDWADGRAGRRSRRVRTTTCEDRR